MAIKKDTGIRDATVNEILTVQTENQIYKPELPHGTFPPEPVDVPPLPKIKKQIKITYLVTLADERIESLIAEGVATAETIKRDLKRGGIGNHVLIDDYVVESVEDIEEQSNGN